MNKAAPPTAALPCPNSECRHPVVLVSNGGEAWTECKHCHYTGPRFWGCREDFSEADIDQGAIRLHNAICAPAVQATADADEVVTALAKEIILTFVTATGGGFYQAGVESVIRKHLRKAVSPKAAADEPLGSSVCPICGRDTPHYHPPEVVSQHYGAVKSGSLNQNDASPAAVSGDKQEKERG